MTPSGKYPLHEVLVSPLVGGAAIVAIRLASAASAHGFACTAWVPGIGPAAAALTQERVEWRLYDLAGLHGGRTSQVLASARFLRGIIGTKRPIVHVHNPLVYRLLAPALAMVRARAIAHFHIETSTEDIDWALRFPPDAVVACARYIGAQVERRLPDERRKPRVHVIPNGVDVERYTPGSKDEARASVDLQTDAPVLLVMANLAPHKGQSTAIRATAELRRAGIHAECWLAGEDRTSRHYEQELRSLSRSLEVSEQIKFLGFRNDGLNLLRAADVLLLPSTHEGLPLSVLEAQASGIPVVGAPIDGILEIVTNDATGFIVSPDDPVGYARTIANLITDGNLRARITEAALKSVRENHGLALLQEKTFDVYRSLT